MSVHSSEFGLEREFEVSVECKVYSMGREHNIGETSVLVDGEFIGWVSVSTSEVSLSDEQVVSMLDDAHVPSELARDVIQACVPPRHLRSCGVTGGQRLEVEDVWVSGHVTREALGIVAEEFDNGERIVDSVEDLADELEIVE